MTLIKSPCDSLRAAWGALYQTCAALRTDKSIPAEKKQIFLDRIDALQDDIALLSADIKNNSSTPDPNTNTKKDG